MRAPAGWPSACSSSASVRVDFDVHRNGDCGSPRVAGSTSASNAPANDGSVSVSGGRPAPARRTLPAGAPACGSSSSLIAAVTVVRDTPAARATADTPPRPNARASTPSHNRRCRSSKNGAITPYLAATTCSTGPIHAG